MLRSYHVEQLQEKKYYELCKRFFDICVSIILLVIFTPLFLIIMLAIRVNSPGPVIFSQKRIGINRRRTQLIPLTVLDRRKGPELKGQPITIYKFRTMRMDADPYGIKAKTPKDERITATGKFLRATSMDELPQFFNVLKGDLSIVGPRPEMPFIVESYGPLEAQRLQVKPGITGLWQIYATRQKHIHENIHFDLDYIQNRSLLLDFIILIKTAFFIIRTQNL